MQTKLQNPIQLLTPLSPLKPLCKMAVVDTNWKIFLSPGSNLPPDVYFLVKGGDEGDLEEREGASAKGDEDEGDTIIDMFIKPAYDESDTLKKD